MGNSSPIPLQRTQSAWIILLLLPRITSTGVAPTAIASASVSCLSSSSLVSEKKKRSHRKLLALHCSPQLVFCGGHLLMQPLHNNGTKIGMGDDLSYEPQLPVSKASLVVVWLSYLQTRPTQLQCPRRPCHRGPGSKLKPCRCGPKQTHRPQSVISVTAINGRRQLTFLLSRTIGFPVPSNVHKILFP